MGPIETEFDPTEFSAEFVAVEQDETLSSILDRVAEALRRTPNVVLIIPRGSQAFHSTQDFLALGKLQWTGEVRVAVASPDPTIAGLARVLGFHIVDAPVGHPSIADDPSSDQANAHNADVEQPTAPLPLGGKPEWVISPAVPAFGTPSSSLTTSTWLNMPGDSPQRGSAAPQPAPRAGVPPPRTRPRQTGVLLLTSIADAPPLTPMKDPALDPKTEDGDAKARRAAIDAKAYKNHRGWRYNGGVRTMRWSRIFAALAVLLVAALIAGSAYAYVYLPQGTIVVRPLDMPIQGLPVEVVVVTEPGSGNGQQPDGSANGTREGAAPLSGPTITAIAIESALSEQATAPATGSRQIATGRGQGSIRFANQTGAAKFVPSGTQFKAANGIIVQTTQGATVPATNLLAGTIGRAEVPVEATVDGPDGNIGAGQITGIYGGALEYENSALTGGSIATLKVITQADIDALVSSLNSKIQGEAAGAVALKVQNGEQLITHTISLTNTAYVSDRKAGEDGETVTVTVTGTARAFTYSEEKMDESVSQAITDYVFKSGNVRRDGGPVLDMGSIKHDAPVMASVDEVTGHVTYTTNADALVKRTLTPELARQIRDLVKGQDVAKAQELIEQTYQGILAAQPIQAKVLWFNISKLPDDPTHIVVELGGGAGSQVTATTGDSGSNPPTTNARPSQR
ncbi:MAG: hypothetical protein ABI670_15795 [Chloroflexota bacterium]